jgi:hypothetical protein
VESSGEASCMTRPAWAGVVDGEVRPMVIGVSMSGHDMRVVTRDSGRDSALQCPGTNSGIP